MSDLWTTASTDAAKTDHDRLFTSLRVEAASYWPFLAGAENPSDFSNRVALIAPELDKLVQARTQDAATFLTARAELEDSFVQDFDVLHQARKVEAYPKGTQRCSVCGGNGQGEFVPGKKRKNYPPQAGHYAPCGGCQGKGYHLASKTATDDYWDDADPSHPDFHKGYHDAQNGDWDETKNGNDQYGYGFNAGSDWKRHDEAGDLAHWDETAPKPRTHPSTASKEASDQLTDDDLREMAAQGNELAAGMLRIREDRAHSREQMDRLKNASKTAADYQGTRSAEVKGGASSLEQVQAYLPSNYTAAQSADGTIWITGHDNAGWTLDGYVIPRLASGLIFAKEIGGSGPDDPANYNATYASVTATRKGDVLIAGEGAYITDAHNSAIKHFVDPGTAATAAQGYQTWAGTTVYDWAVEGQSSDEWQLGGEWLAPGGVTASKTAGEVQVAKPGHWEDGEYVNEPGFQTVDEDEFRKKHNLPAAESTKTATDFSGVGAGNPFSSGGTDVADVAAGASAQVDPQMENSQEPGMGGDDLSPQVPDSGQLTTAHLWSVGCLDCGNDYTFGRVTASMHCECGSHNLVYEALTDDDGNPIVVGPQETVRHYPGGLLGYVRPDEGNEPAGEWRWILETNGQLATTGFAKTEAEAHAIVERLAPMYVKDQDQKAASRGVWQVTAEFPPKKKKDDSDSSDDDSDSDDKKNAPTGTPATPPPPGGAPNPNGAPDPSALPTAPPAQAPGAPVAPGTDPAAQPAPAAPGAAPAAPGGAQQGTVADDPNAVPVDPNAAQVPGAPGEVVDPMLQVMDTAQDQVDASVDQVNQLGHDAKEIAYDVDQLFSEWRCGNCQLEGRADISEDGQVTIDGDLFDMQPCASPAPPEPDENQQPAAQPQPDQTQTQLPQGSPASGGQAPEQIPQQTARRKTAEDSEWCRGCGLKDAPSHGSLCYSCTQKRSKGEPLEWRHPTTPKPRNHKAFITTAYDDLVQEKEDTTPGVNQRSVEDQQNGVHDEGIDKEERLTAMVERILDTNPGMNTSAARKVAEATIARYPSVA